MPPSRLSKDSTVLYPLSTTLLLYGRHLTNSWVIRIFTHGIHQIFSSSRLDIHLVSGLSVTHLFANLFHFPEINSFACFGHATVHFSSCQHSATFFLCPRSRCQSKTYNFLCYLLLTFHLCRMSYDLQWINYSYSILSFVGRTL